MDQPPPSPSRRRFLLPLLVLAVAAGLGLFSRSETLHVINAGPAEAQLELPDGALLELGANQRAEVELPPGEHDLTVHSGDRQQRVAVRLAVSLGERLTGRPLFVLNVGGRAALLRQETVYGDVDLSAAPDQLLTGEPFVRLDHVDYPFQPFPDESPNTGVAVRLEWLQGPPPQVVARFPAGCEAQALDYLERALREDPDDTPSLRAWVQRAEASGDEDRLLRFLETQLARWPPALEWHRCYQDALLRRGRAAELLPRYEALLREHPGSSAALYLRGRLAGTAPEALDLYRRALDADRTNVNAARALALRLAARGDWDAAWEALGRILGPAGAMDPDVQELRFRLREARGELEALETELAEAQREHPLDPNLQRRRLEVLATRGDLDAARRAHARYAQAAQQTLGRNDPHQLALLSELWLGELSGAPDPAAAAKLHDPARRRRFQLRALLLAGQLEQAEQLLEGDDDPWSALELALAATAAGDDARRRTWLARAAERAPTLGPRGEVLAKVLRGEAPLDQALADPLETAALAVVLAAEHPQQATRLRAQARELTRRPVYPAPLIERALAR